MSAEREQSFMEEMELYLGKKWSRGCMWLEARYIEDNRKYEASLKTHAEYRKRQKMKKFVENY
jgi:hypothetical protein